MYYWLICCLSKKTIVLEKIFKKRLTNLKINDKKIFVILHPVDNNLKLEIQKKAKNNSLLYFGYLTWYKGIDWLIENINKKMNLTIAGGPSPTLKNKSHYKNFLKKIIENIKQRKNIKITGFVKERQLPKYFQSNKICVLPYRVMMSSSGPLSFCFSFEKPFILSRPLEGYFESEDFSQALKETGLRKEDFIFNFNIESFEKRLKWAKNNLKKLSHFSKIMKEKRSWDKVARMYLKVLQEE
jgi:glycosyltransferase involved in cell wall biosynthesis